MDINGHQWNDGWSFLSPFLLKKTGMHGMSHPAALLPQRCRWEPVRVLADEWFRSPPEV